MSIDNRNRVRKGVSTGGQFAAEARAESTGAKLNAKATEDIGRWQRSIDSRYGGDHWPEDAPLELREASDKAEKFSHLSSEEQLDLAGVEYAPFLKTGQKFGNDRVVLADDFVHNEEDTVVGLQTQKISDKVIKLTTPFAEVPEPSRAMAVVSKIARPVTRSRGGVSSKRLEIMDAIVVVTTALMMITVTILMAFGLYP